MHVTGQCNNTLEMITYFPILSLSYVTETLLTTFQTAFQTPISQSNYRLANDREWIRLTMLNDTREDAQVDVIVTILRPPPPYPIYLPNIDYSLASIPMLSALHRD